MKLSRKTTLAVALALSVIAPTACKPVENDAAKAGAKAVEADTDGVEKTAGLPTERQQVSYMIGMDIGKSLKPLKDEVDMETLQRAINDVFEDKKLLLDDEQLKLVAQALASKMQAKQIATGADFLMQNSKKPGVVTTASGLQYQVVTAGKGAKPSKSDSVKVHFRGTLLDGSQFDSSYDRNEPVIFNVSQVVPGWTEALQLMPVGSKYKLWVPSALGYGEQGTPGGPIPPNATLVFDVELIEIMKP